MAAEKIEFARARAQDVARLGELSDSVFRPQLIPGTGMPKEFPLAFSAENAHNLYFAAVDGRPVSLVALYPSRLVVPGGHVSAVSMGSVCTLPEFREQHLASQLIHQILTDFSPHTSLLLVSGGRGLYRRLGCVDFGERVEADVALAGLPAGDTEWVVNPVPEPEAEVAALSRLYAAEPYRYERSEAEFRMLLRSLRTPLFRMRPVPPQVFAAWSRTGDGGIAAYAVASFVLHEGRAGVEILEWAGRRAACPAIWRYVLSYYGVEVLRVRGYVHDEAFLDALTQAEAILRRVPNQGTIRVLNPSRCAMELRPYAASVFGAGFSFEPRGEEAWQVVWEAPPALRLPEERKAPLIAGWAALSEWLFGSQGLCLTLPHTDDLNYV
ncbi:hypothetical protein GCM10010885_21940 [Alicyclobacillus cellulosilyticus]|uniref:N-acetyltransferase domain-containing protein n=1 Tax=Alicyclobacillus cellulosilyticus TaxID=1003997 RepID=A0A917KH55_9BACL|nr:GNAT family N-acetyltransferase [Alicyclobacillus cellulosilyticus]GGJ12194.1 hypothetical protein GCM10010885_21940 [Alicyclobacillus cellulosilyticus]